jgi:hypothetical protein
MPKVNKSKPPRSLPYKKSKSKPQKTLSRLEEVQEFYRSQDWSKEKNLLKINTKGAKAYKRLKANQKGRPERLSMTAYRDFDIVFEIKGESDEILNAPLSFLGDAQVHPTYIGHSREEGEVIYPIGSKATKFLGRFETIYNGNLVAHAFALRLVKGCVQCHEPMRLPSEAFNTARNSLVADISAKMNWNFNPKLDVFNGCQEHNEFSCVYRSIINLI